MIMIMMTDVESNNYNENDAASNLLQLAHTRHVGQAHLDIRLGQHLHMIMIMIMIMTVIMIMTSSPWAHWRMG